MTTRLHDYIRMFNTRHRYMGRTIWHYYDRVTRPVPLISVRRAGGTLNASGTATTTATQGD